MTSFHRPFLAALAGIALVLPLATGAAAAPGGPGDPPGRTRADRQLAAAADALPTPQVHWHDCDGGQCAQVTVPMDYARPRGASVSIALTRLPATDPERRIGTLFVNPGGPGVPGASWVAQNAALFSEDLRARFDIVGFDPRGVGQSTRLECFSSAQAQESAYAPLTRGFPMTRAEEAAYRAAARDLARACRDRPLTAHMSTANVARDLDVLRRAVGDEQLTYLGFSYGTYLGQVYAAMYPGRVRAMALDGVVDAEAWRGTRATAAVPMPVRMGTAEGASAALGEVLDRCLAAGDACPLEDPHAALDAVGDRLRSGPVRLGEEFGGVEVTYSDLVNEMLFALYVPRGETVVEVIAGWQALLPPAEDAAAQIAASGAGAAGESAASVSAREAGVARASASEAFGSEARRVAARGPGKDAHPERKGRGRARPVAPGLPNDLEVNASIMCGDSLHTTRPSEWSRLAQRAERATPFFGRQAVWAGAVCADWQVTDPGAFRGAFSSDAPMVVVGALWDPSTPYAAAQRVSERFPRSALVTSDNWGHTSYGVSACADAAVDAHLLSGRVPGDVTCTDGVQPYAEVGSW